jgi:putative transposase
MKKSRFSESQIIAILKQEEAGTPVLELCREYGMSSALFYKWRSRYGGMDTSMMARLKELKEENRRLKKMYAEERLKAEILAEAMQKKWWRPLGDARWRNGKCNRNRSPFEQHAGRSASVKPVIDIRRNCLQKTARLPTA